MKLLHTGGFLELTWGENKLSLNHTPLSHSSAAL